MVSTDGKGESDNNQDIPLGAGYARQTREFIKNNPDLHNWAGEISDPTDYALLSKLTNFWSTLKRKGMIPKNARIEDHPIIGQAVKNIRSRNINNGIQKHAGELGLFTFLAGQQETVLSALGISGRGVTTDIEVVQRIFDTHMDPPGSGIHIYGQTGSGKTTTAVSILEYRKNSKPDIMIASNIRSLSGIEYTFIDDLDTLIAWKEAYPLNEKWFLGDEMSTHWNARNHAHKGNKDMAEETRKIRKVESEDPNAEGCKLILIGHSEDDIDKYGRDSFNLRIEKDSRLTPHIAHLHFDDNIISIKDLVKPLSTFNDKEWVNFNTNKAQ